VVQVLVAAPQDVLDLLAGSRLVRTPDVSFVFVSARSAVLSWLGATPAPDVVLLDFELPGLSGIKGIQTLVPHLRQRPLGALVHDAPLELARRTLDAGAQGVVPTAAPREAFVAAIALLKARQRFVIFSAGAETPGQDHAEMLSERELQVLHAICDGLQNKEIAHDFQIQEVTVKMHVRAIIRKLDARNRTHAAMIARNLGIV
jgi:two-component system, NarL family, nitrate/nitrite response regulator NarL